MAEQFQFNQRADLSTIVGRNKIIASSIGLNDEIVLLTVAPEFEKDPFGRDERNGHAIFPSSKSKRHYPATFIRFDGREVLQKTELAELDIAFPHIQPLPDGDVSLVGARCYYRDGDPEKNAIVFSRDGKVLRRFVLGDGIKSVQTTPDGMIWVSYFDEGVFGNYGWNQPMGASGLICFDSAGRILWEFAPPTGFDSICDCYALNVAKDAVWACYYTDFPLVKIGSDKRVQGWKNEIGGANALAVNDRYVLLWGGYGDKHTRCVLQNFGDQTLTQSRELSFNFPSGLDLKGIKIVGRGSMLHAIADKTWFAFDTNQI